MPARYVISTAMIPVPALTVPACFRTAIKLEAQTHSCLMHGQNNLSSLSQGWSLMTSPTLAVLHWINVHAYTATVFIILESPTITAVDPGKITTWVPFLGCHIQTHVLLTESKVMYTHMTICSIQWYNVRNLATLKAIWNKITPSSPPYIVMIVKVIFYFIITYLEIQV